VDDYQSHTVCNQDLAAAGGDNDLSSLPNRERLSDGDEILPSGYWDGTIIGDEEVDSVEHYMIAREPSLELEGNVRREMVVEWKLTIGRLTKEHGLITNGS
jgi:hypothetical protein